MQIKWHRCASYDDAKEFSRVIYLHEWDGKPFYWGAAPESFFGGHKRTRGGLTATGRYTNGYRHWIEGCLKHGGRLYIGVPETNMVERIVEIEAYLILTYPSEMNRKIPTSCRNMTLRHAGDVPLCLQHVDQTSPTPG